MRLLIPLVVFMLLAAAACGDNGDDEPDALTPPDATGEAADLGNNDDADDGLADDEPGTADDGVEATPDTAPEPGDDPSARLYEGFSTETYHVTWEVDSTIPDVTLAGPWTRVQDSGGDRRLDDVDGSVMGLDDPIISLSAPDGSLICMEQACLGIPEGQPIFGVPGQALEELLQALAADVTGESLREIDGRAIAGVEVQCRAFDASHAGDAVQGVACESEEQVPLFLEWQSPEGDFSMEATSYSTSVSEEDFDPPHSVTDMSMPEED